MAKLKWKVIKVAKKVGIQTEDLYELKSVVDPQLSPNGREVVYVQTHIDKEKNDYVSNLYFMNIDDNDPKQWTYGNHRTNSPKWSPDGNELAFVSNREGSPQIYILS